MDDRTYTTPRALRTAYDLAGGDWTQLLSPAQLALPLVPENYGGHATIASWIADGPAGRAECLTVWGMLQGRPWPIQQPPRQPGNEMPSFRSNQP